LTSSETGAGPDSPGPPLVFDGHNATLLDLHLPERGERRTFFDRGDAGHLDLPRAREGGFGGGFFACWAPPDPESCWTEESALTLTEDGYDVTDAPPLDPAYAKETAGELAEILFKIEAGAGGRIKVVRTAEELEASLREGVLAAVLHFEGAENLGLDPGALEDLFEMGLRSLGLVWSRPNAYGHGVPFRFPASPNTGPGLTYAGRELVRECNRLGVLIDLSHLNERGFWDVAETTEAPLVATHSNAYTLYPTTRNLTDGQLDAIRNSDGMVGVNFAVGFLREDGKDEEDTPIETVVRHVDYLVERVGVERVGFGSDFDGAKVLREIGDASGLLKVFAALRERGYDDAALRKLAHENWVRVLRAIWGK
jgi:membrane dipeptidase